MPAPGPPPAREVKGLWRNFDEAAIPGLVAEGKVVFVDVTADWCITCQANKALVLNRGQVAERLGGKGVVAMRADWTRPDPVIAQYLAKYGRYGIPFNVVYGPNAPRGIPLPELLTSDAVLAAFDDAGDGAGRIARRP
jgi:suppressor for copper-sensitivity B